MRAEESGAETIRLLLTGAQVGTAGGLLGRIQRLLQLLDLLLDVRSLPHAALFLFGRRDRLDPPEVADEVLLLGLHLRDLALDQLAILHDARSQSLHLPLKAAMGATRHAGAVAACTTNLFRVLAGLFLFALLPRLVSGGADVVQKPIDTLAHEGHGDDQPLFELAHQRVPLRFEHRHFALVFLEPAHILLGRPEALLVRDVEVVVQFRHERNRLDAHALE